MSSERVIATGVVAVLLLMFASYLARNASVSVYKIKHYMVEETS